MLFLRRIFISPFSSTVVARICSRPRRSPPNTPLVDLLAYQYDRKNSAGYLRPTDDADRVSTAEPDEGLGIHCRLGCPFRLNIELPCATLPPPPSPDVLGSMSPIDRIDPEMFQRISAVSFSCHVIIVLP